MILLFKFMLPLSIYNVWIIRRFWKSRYRSGNASTLFEEFQVFGYSRYFFYFIGIMKICCASLILFGTLCQIMNIGDIESSFYVYWGTLILLILMIGALASHIRVRDDIEKLLPAAFVLLLASVLFYSLG